MAEPIPAPELRDTLARLAVGGTLARSEMRAAVRTIMSGGATPAQIGSFLSLLHVRGETVAELTGAAEAMRELVTPVNADAPHLVDTCGTGGSGYRLFNISTAAAFVAAAAGAHVAKHGNRAMTSASGSADVLEHAGVQLDLTPEQVARCIRDVGVGFLFAQLHHASMRHAAGPRREIGLRSVFNLLGPLTNPAGAPNQVAGVALPAFQRPVAEVLQTLGSRRALVVRGAEGLDELSTMGPSYVIELRDGRLDEYTIHPEDFDLPRADYGELTAASAEESYALMRQALREPESAASAIVALNGGAAIYTAGVALDLADGVTMAQDVIAAGLAWERLDALVRISSLMAEG